MPVYTLTVNGRQHTVSADPDTPLLWILRDNLGLTGTKYGCGEGVCGACTVHEDGEPMRACLLTVAEASGRSFVTIEALSSDGSHPCQRAWVQEDVAQCGYCQPGMIMAAAALLRTTPNPTDADIDRVFSSHVCRCGTFAGMRRAIRRAAGMEAQ
jgi:aerobic-type carbon monoxide dehydrogenase small subunit (CoxS/CutS family)